MYKNIFFLCIFLYVNSIFADKRQIESKNSESFEILAYDAVVKVSSPMKFSEKSGVVITNETNNDLYVKIENRPIIPNAQEIDSSNYLTIKSHQSKGMELEFRTDRRYYIIPLSPSFQEIELVFGNKTYEIPDPLQRN